jgi:prephenate dehydrogenase/chorismate mutase
MFGEAQERWQSGLNSDVDQGADSSVDRQLVLKEALGEVRGRIDEIDEQIAALLAKRLGLAKGIAPIKMELGMAIKDESREQEVIKKASSVSADKQVASAISNIYEVIMAESCHLQDVPQKASALYFPSVLIIGLGLIGGSFARQIKKQLHQTKITAFDKTEVLHEALGDQVIDEAADELSKAVPQAQLIVLSANPDANLKILAEIAPHLQSGQLVIDLTSTKENICNVANAIDLHGANFIGAHPFFGSEKSGFAASSEINADQKVICLTPTQKSSQITLKRLTRWLNLLNFQVDIMDATTHDAIAARISHVVQLLSVILGAEIAETCSQATVKKGIAISGPAFKQLLRLMKSPAAMWVEIIGQNKEQVLQVLKGFERRLQLIVSAMEAGDDKKLKGELTKIFQAAARVKSIS